jgi:hypothetical protein
VVFSAGMNPRLYNYLGSCKEFDIDDEGRINKRVIIKVSDYRSALIQGKYLAKKGIWVSEFRIESGLNCGGHAFATDGFLLGPILEEFKSKREELKEILFGIYSSALMNKDNKTLSSPPALILSVQGGIGTYEEDDFLHKHYNVNSTGWGTPFLLVPEATTVDSETLNLLCAAKQGDVELGNNSPLGVKFHYLKNTSAHKERLARINNNRPGSPCTEKHLSFNTEFTKEPICTASQKYQRLKIDQLQSLGLPESAFKQRVAEVLDKECLCIGLSNSAAKNHNQTFVKKLEAVTVCPGPNIVNFSSVVSLQTMVDHIYGRENILSASNRPHMFIAEMHLYIDFLKDELAIQIEPDQLEKKKKYHALFYQNLREGIKYYRSLPDTAISNQQSFIQALDLAEMELDGLNYSFQIFDHQKESSLMS